MAERTSEIASAGKNSTGDLAGKIQQSHLPQTETHTFHHFTNNRFCQDKYQVHKKIRKTLHSFTDSCHTYTIPHYIDISRLKNTIYSIFWQNNFEFLFILPLTFCSFHAIG
jgi:hypothetical protein